MHSRLLFSSLPRSLPPLLGLPAPRDFLGSRGGSAPLLFPPSFLRSLLLFRLSTWTYVNGVLIPWIRATRRELRERFWQDLPDLRLHSDRGSEFSSSLLEELCRDEGIRQTFTLPASPQLSVHLSDFSSSLASFEPPFSSEFPPITAPLQTLHMDVWGTAPVSGTDQERYFLLIRATRRELRERFWQDLPDLRLHSDRGSEFSSSLLEELCRDEGIRQTFTLPASPQLSVV
ncbi:unnamed protein product [Closterium sp. NIES-54]